MYFEAAEKKVEIIRVADSQSLRNFEKSFWVGLVAVANAEILSSIHNEHCDAYLLSESSLFVWDNKFIMITCGKSTLINSVQYFLEQTDPNQISYFSYQRKNECYSQFQKSSFQQDIQAIDNTILGKSKRVGNLDNHHHYLFTSDKIYSATLQNNKQEFLMYQIDEVLALKLQHKAIDPTDVRKLLQIDSLFNGFILDDHSFEPYGYSINGIQNDLYFTIHITPQDESSYASFETNMDLSKNNFDVISKLLDIFKPVSLDIIGFNQQNSIQLDNFWLLAESNFTTQHSFPVSYQHFHKSQVQTLIPQNV